jgi:hypothetical protein
MNTVVRAIMWIMFAFVTVAWAAIGFILWVPLLVRATTVFSAMVVHATITAQRPDALRNHLESACRFYPEGFRIAYDERFKRCVNLSLMQKCETVDFLQLAGQGQL